MKKLFLTIFLFIGLCSCATTDNTMGTMEHWDAQEAACRDKTNFNGFTQTQILEKLGEPVQKDTSNAGNTRLDTWRYNTSCGATSISFKDGVVDRVSYPY